MTTSYSATTSLTTLHVTVTGVGLSVVAEWRNLFSVSEERCCWSGSVCFKAARQLTLSLYLARGQSL